MEDGRCEFFQTLSIGVGVKRLLNLRHIPAIYIFQTPLRNHSRPDFRVELQVISGLAHAECLILSQGRSGKQSCTMRQIEGIRMLLEKGFPMVQLSQHRVLLPFFCQINFEEPYFLVCILVNGSTRNFCQPLASKADTQNGNIVG